MRSLHLPSLTTVALLLSAAPGTLFAQGGSPPSGGGGHSDVGIAVRFGTLGLGLEVSKLLTGHIAARVGGNYFKVSTTKDQTNITYDASLKLQAFSALIDLFPGKRGGFHLTAGIMTNPAKVTATGQPTASGTFTINNNTYTTAQVGTLIAEGKFKSVAPYVGIGFGTPARNGGALGFLFDLGAVIGKPTITLSATGAAGNAALASDLQAQVASTQTDVDKYAKVYPVLDFGLIYRF